MSSSTCPLPCLWAGTQSCALHQLKGNLHYHTRLSLGQLEGLKGMYHPHPLPPCLDSSGFVHLSLEEYVAHPLLAPVQPD